MKTMQTMHDHNFTFHRIIMGLKYLILSIINSYDYLATTSGCVRLLNATYLEITMIMGYINILTDENLI